MDKKIPFIDTPIGRINVGDYIDYEELNQGRKVLAIWRYDMHGWNGEPIGFAFFNRAVTNVGSSYPINLSKITKIIKNKITNWKEVLEQ